MDYGLQTAPGFALYRSEAETERAVTVHSLLLWTGPLRFFVELG